MSYLQFFFLKNVQIYVTIFAKTDHSAQILDIKSLVPRCSVLIALCKSEVRITVVYTVPELGTRTREMIFSRNKACERSVLQNVPYSTAVHVMTSLVPVSDVDSSCDELRHHNTPRHAYCEVPNP